MQMQQVPNPSYHITTTVDRVISTAATAPKCTVPPVYYQFIRDVVLSVSPPPHPSEPCRLIHCEDHQPTGINSLVLIGTSVSTDTNIPNCEWDFRVV
jgi:hypothetical protein